MDGLIRQRSEAEAKRIEESWGSLCWLAGKEISDTEGLTVGRVTIRKGMSNPRHSHPNCDEVLYLLQGRLEHSIGKEIVILEAGDTLVIHAGVPHHAASIGEEDADMMVAYSSGIRQFQLDE